MNIFSFTGNVGKDCETRVTQNGKTVASFSVAVSSGFGDNKKTTWVNCKLLGKKAESKLPEMIKKGMKVAVSGEMTLEEWEKDGQKNHSLSVVVNEFEFMSKRDSEPAHEVTPAQSDSFNDDIPF